MELLSPAGSYESLIAAVQSGADAVYLGGSKFGARQSAANFSSDEMKKWTDYCHLYGVKVYVTVNTLVKDSETAELAEYIRELSLINIDGVIVQDLGALTVIRTVAPHLSVHGSTQMTVTSLEDVRFLENQGFSRVVLSRELSFHEIEHICANTDCEIEVFVHGALCMSYSGQCLMSSILGGRSGNRGRCAQPCRLPYTLEGMGDKLSAFLLSPKDLCLVNELDKLKKAGVSSLKIEGRLKRAGYVSTVVGIYRQCIDRGQKASKEDMKNLRDAFGRGFTTGFFGGECGDKMMNIKNSSNAADNVFTKEALDRCRENSDNRKIRVSISAEAHLGEPLVVKMTDCEGNSVVCKSSILCQPAEKTPTGAERLTDALLKLGGTPYECADIKVDIDDMAVIPVSAINSARRDVCSLMNEKRLQRTYSETYPLVEKRLIKKKSKPEIYCDVQTRDQYEVAKRLGIKNIIAPCEISDNESIIKCSPVSKGGLVNGSRVYVSTLGQLENANDSQVLGSHRLNITNSYSADFYSAFMKRSVLSAELSLKEISYLTSGTELGCGIIAYGRLDLMLCGNCPIKAAGKCQKNKSLYSLKDRKGERFPLICSDNCSVRVLNSKPVYMADKWKDIENSGVEFVSLVFTTETGKECEELIRRYLDAAEGKEVPSMKENSFTRGHFYRGVL